MTDGHCVCHANCELSVNSGLISIVIVIVIVIGCHLLPLFFLKRGTLIFGFLLYNYNRHTHEYHITI